MKSYAVVKDNVVENMISWDGETPWSPPDGCEVILVPENIQCAIGWTYDGNIFSEPVLPPAPSPPTPEEITVTIEQLQAQLNTITSQLQQLMAANTSSG